jgi:hypothetical protein
MKLTIEIPDARTGDVLQFLAGLIPATVEATADPAPGHPELPLVTCATEDDGDLRWCVAGELDDPAAADPLKVVMDDPVEDTRPRLKPETGKTYRTREGIQMHVVGEYQADTDDIEAVCHLGSMYYRIDGKPRVSHLLGTGWDLVEEIQP